MKRIISLFLAFAIVISACLIGGSYTLSAGKMKLNKKTITLKPGETFKLVVKNKKKTVKWTSNKKKVATVSKKGKVKAKKIGNAKITAKVGKVKLVCKVKVRGEGKPQNVQPTNTPQQKPGKPTNAPAITPAPGVTPDPQATKEPEKEPTKKPSSLLDMPVKDSDNSVEFPDIWY